jgi:2-phosphosulfolactate phosphatase
MALAMYRQAKEDLFGFMKENNASHYMRLSNYGLEKDIKYCLTPDQAPVLPIFKGDRLVCK